jgi:ribonuclease P protein component
MISSQHRFHGYNSLNFVYRHGATTRDNNMSLRFVRNARRSTHRIAVIVSRKVHKSAVRRNRIRRRLYEIIRAQEAAITDPYDIVLTVFSDTLAEVPAGTLSRSVTGLLQKSGVIKTAGNSPASRHHAIVTNERG